MAKFPTFIPGRFYVSGACGGMKCGSKQFETLDDGIKAAISSVKRSLGNARAHGTGSVDVMQVIPGTHVTRAIVTPELDVIYR